MKSKVLLLTSFIITCYFTNANGQQGISNVEIIQHTAGKYTIKIALADSFPNDILLDRNIYNLWEKKTGEKVQLPEPILWMAKPGKGVRFVGVDITYKKEYIIQFKDFKANIQSNTFSLRTGQKGFDEFEKGKSVSWRTSIKPKISQGDSTINDLGDLGFELSLSRKLPRKFEFNFDASVTSNENDPNNHWKLSLDWRPVDLWLLYSVTSKGESNSFRNKSARIVLRPLTLSLQENATQGLTLHDLSIRAFTSISVRLFSGIQPIFLTAGLDEAVRIARDGEDFDDPRVHLQIQWGMVGLVGNGSDFFINWQYWHRLDNFGDPKIDPSQKKERKYIELEFVLPIVEGKNLTVKYADGEVAPTFTNDKTIHIGLEILFGGQRILGPK